MDILKEIHNIVQEELPSLIALRHDLHTHPELAYQEYRTNEIIQNELKKLNIEYKAGLAGGTGILAHIPSNNSTLPAIGLRADMDALPIKEETLVEYKSKNSGVMHACGHDGHTTILIGAARILSRIAKKISLSRPISFLFQPAEEQATGGMRMIQDGCLDGSVLGSPIKYIFGLHGWPSLPVGYVATRNGPITAATDFFKIIIKGKGSHAAFPHTGSDPIVAGAAIVSGIQSIVSRNINPLDAAVISITQFQAGNSFNVIPDQLELKGTIRTLSPYVKDLVKERFIELVNGISIVYGCQAEVEYISVAPATINDSHAVSVFNNVASDILKKDNVIALEQPIMAGEDFAFYTQKIQACFFFLGLQPSNQTSIIELHHPSFNFNDDAIAIGVELFCRLGLSKEYI